ncbi:hypothetical protein CPB83DRAFT_907241 [Crepidotus variabilis]|uniref:Uncharacterized protein n=1 Tax=Crepidotus variabilis TaxID=179855 RepID=A0A9P6JPJ3_9AGAR|nr:hypothetical protein CPB83DRAFT_907241 [Crepidotus variabilis]
MAHHIEGADTMALGTVSTSSSPQVDSASAPSPAIRPRRTTSLSINLHTLPTSLPKSSPALPPTLPLNPNSSHPYAKKLAPLAITSINAVYSRKALVQDPPITGSSKSFHSIEEELREAPPTTSSSRSFHSVEEEPLPLSPVSPITPISPISPILSPKARIPIMPVMKIRPGGSRSAPMFTSPQAQHLKFLNKGESTRSLSDSASSISQETSHSSENFTLEGLARQVTKSSSNLSEESSKVVRVHGRGGAGRRVRPVRVEGSLPRGPPSNSLSPNKQTAFVRPMGRGGMGSRPKNATVKIDSPQPEKGPRKAQSTPNFAELLRRKTKPSKGKEKVIESVPEIAATSTHFDLRDDSDDLIPQNRLYPHTFRGRAGSEFREDGNESEIGSPPVSATSATFEAAYEEYERRKLAAQNEQRERSANKLTRTLGDVPTGLFEALTGNRSNGGRTKSDAEKPTHRPTASLGRTIAAPVGPRGRSSFRNSVAALAALSNSERINYPGDSRGPLSPVSFAFANIPVPPSPSPVPPSPGIYSLFPPCETFPPSPSIQTHFPPCDIFPPDADEEEETDSVLTTPVLTLHSDSSGSISPLPLTPITDVIIPDVIVSQSGRSRSPSPPPNKRKRKSTLQIQAHSLATTCLAPPPNTPTSHSFLTSMDAPDDLIEFHNSWLTQEPASPTQMDYDAILVSGRSRDKPTTFSGEWNVDMHEVIQALRELR